MGKSLSHVGISPWTLPRFQEHFEGQTLALPGEAFQNTPFAWLLEEPLVSPGTHFIHTTQVGSKSCMGTSALCLSQGGAELTTALSPRNEDLETRDC